MSDVKWIKIVTDIFDDEKILLIESLPEHDAIIVIWFKLLCLAGKQNNRGVFLVNDSIPYTDEMFATVFRRNINTVRLALKTFHAYGMVDIVEGTVTIPNWSKHQNIEGMEKRKEYQREYMRNYREDQKKLASGKQLCKHLHKPLCKQNVSTPDIDTDKDKEEDIITPKTHFKPPSVDEVGAYCRERENGIDPSKFVDYYETRGWMLGKTKMKDWKAAVRTWEKNTKGETTINWAVN